MTDEYIYWLSCQELPTVYEHSHSCEVCGETMIYHSATKTDTRRTCSPECEEQTTTLQEAETEPQGRDGPLSESSFPTKNLKPWKECKCKRCERPFWTRGGGIYCGSLGRSGVCIQYENVRLQPPKKTSPLSEDETKFHSAQRQNEFY